MPSKDSLNTRRDLNVGEKTYVIYSLKAAEEAGLANVSRLPVSMKVLLENLLRHEGPTVSEDDLHAMAAWVENRGKTEHEIAYRPARVLMQDFTGVPAVVDLAAMRDAMRKLGADPDKINPLNPVDLVIDHSVMVDHFGTPEAFGENVDQEYQRNGERYRFLRWGSSAFADFRVVPPGTGICHQVNLEYLAQTVWTATDQGESLKIEDGQFADSETGEPMEVKSDIFAYPDTCVGTDSHTTMVNGLSVLGWGVGGIEAEAAMLGQPIPMLIPEVVGFKLTGRLPEGATATDLVLTVTQMLRRKGVVGKFVEYYGDGLLNMTIEDQATIANMAPEYGATCGFFPVSQATIKYLTETGRTPDRVALVEAYAKEQGLWVDADTPEPVFSDTLELDLSTVQPSLAGPKRPQDRVLLSEACSAFAGHLANDFGKAGHEHHRIPVKPDEGQAPFDVGHGDVVIADDLVAVSVLSGNRNFEGRVNPDVRANYLASPPLVVAYALAGSMLHDITRDPLGTDNDGVPVYLRDIWPTSEEIATIQREVVTNALFTTRYADVFKGDEHWQGIQVSGGETYVWEGDSTYVQNPPYFEGLSMTPKAVTDIQEARILAIFGDSITTDHISPAGNIRKTSPAGQYLIAHGVDAADFNSYGARRGNHEVMMRGTFANIRIRNRMTPEIEGGVTKHHPSGQVMAIYDAAMQYQTEGRPLVIFAGKEYGTGSSRDWAAKGTKLLGVRAVFAETYERIHRSNLVGMGVLPLQFQAEGWQRLGLTGEEIITIRGLNQLSPRKTLVVELFRPSDHKVARFPVTCRIDTETELDYFRAGGVMPYVLRNLARGVHEPELQAAE